jgi:integrase
MGETISLTSPISFYRIPPEGMSMKGGIYTKEKCPVCGGKFLDSGSDLICSTHHTRPRRVYVQLYSRLLHKPINICSDSRNIPFSSYEQARRILTVLRAEIDKSGDFDPTRWVSQKLKPLRFSNWSEMWLSKKCLEADKGLRAPSYLKVVKVYVRKYQSFFGNTDIRDIGSKTINDFYLSLSGSPHYLKNIRDCLKKMFQDALDWGDIGIMPKFPKIDVPEADITTIDLDLQDTIINAIPDQMDQAFILFAAREILRPCEPRALQWQDLDFKHDRVTIRRHFSLNQIRPATKAKQIKHLPLDGEVKKILLTLPRHISSPFVFWKGKMGRPFSESWARKLWKRISSTFGVNISLYHGTRHSSATEAADRVGIDATQEFLHHTNRRMTERYVQRNPERLRKVLRKPG